MVSHFLMDWFCKADNGLHIFINFLRSNWLNDFKAVVSFMSQIQWGERHSFCFFDYRAWWEGKSKILIFSL